MKRKLLFLFCLVLAVPLIPVAAQQTATVKGIVTDAQTGEPLIGVSVVVPGTTHGIATDVDGSYELNNVPEDGSLEFSYLGYETRTVAVGGRTVIDVALDMASDQIEELVVVGYAVQRKRDVLGAVNKVRVPNSPRFRYRRLSSPFRGVCRAFRSPRPAVLRVPMCRCVYAAWVR